MLGEYKMIGIIKFCVLYFLNSITFMIQDFRTQDISLKPDYTRHPTVGNLINAIILMPIIPFAPYLRNIVAGRVGKESVIIFFFKIFYTVAIYYFSFSKFSIGSIFAFTITLAILRKVITNK